MSLDDKSWVSPHSHEAEQAILGAILSNRNTLYAVVDILQEIDFYDPIHQIIFRAILCLDNKNRPVDIISVTDQLISSNDMTNVGGQHVLIDIVDRCASIANIDYHVKLVKDYSLLRSLIEAARKIIDMAMRRDGDLDTIFERADSLLFGIINKRDNADYRFLSDYIKMALNQIELRKKTGTALNGLATGYPDIDTLTNGLPKGSLIVLAARAGMGKTAFALNIVRQSLQKITPSDHPTGVLIFSLEMTGEEIAVRLLSSSSKVPIDAINKVNMSEDDVTYFLDAVTYLSGLPIMIDDTGSIPLNTLRARARMIMRKYPYHLMIIDHIQIISIPNQGAYNNRTNMLSQITGTLKALAKELGIPIIALSQLSRGVESRADKTPMLSDLRESGSIEQDADIVAMLYREDYYEKDNTRSEAQGIIELHFTKHRNGRTAMIPLRFFPEILRFDSLTEQGQIAYKQYKSNKYQDTRSSKGENTDFY